MSELKSDPTGSSTHQRDTAGNFTLLDTNQCAIPKIVNLNV